jgi:hypothetical protein
MAVLTVMKVYCSEFGSYCLIRRIIWFREKYRYTTFNGLGLSVPEVCDPAAWRIRIRQAAYVIYPSKSGVGKQSLSLAQAIATNDPSPR